MTENGVCDPDDAERPQFIHDHAAAVLQARAAGIDLAGYFHWSLIDNFEWAQGWTAPFGLIALDPKSQTRKVRPSARVLGSTRAQGKAPRAPPPRGRRTQIARAAEKHRRAERRID